VDIKVLEAQQWVNATYGSVTGYEPCDETGTTGWQTMYALTMGLQHELGISPVVPNFGPTTLAKLTALGDIWLGWNQNTNIVRIFQHALFCKGYWGCLPGQEGTFTPQTQSAVIDLRTNMGIPAGNGTIIPKIARCILNMDAYVVVAGGTEKVRDIQRWLNGRYWDRGAYTIGPADGHYSRDVQKSLMIAIQYELGLSPTGGFGPGTQAGLATHTLGLGATGIFVDFFSAACVFNEPVGDKRTTRRSTFDSELSGFVSAFQEFSQLPTTGVGDYQTWAQLLVSTGDPTRTYSVIASDTRFEITPSRAEWLYDHGYRIVGRYLYDPPGSTLDKEIKPGELATIFGAGLSMFPIYQDNGRRPEDFTYTSGYQAALNAHSLATSYGFNKGAVIYFAVDFDATQYQIDNAIIPYFYGVSAGLANQGKRYVHGVYGSRNVCSNVTAKTFARYSFVSGMSSGFSGNLGFTLPNNWVFNQIQEILVVNGTDSFDLDRDVWRSISYTGETSVNSVANPANDFIEYVGDLYDLALTYGGSRPPSQLVMEYIRHYRYGDFDVPNAVGWQFLLGGYDAAFVNYVENEGYGIMPTFTDPYTGYDIGPEHMMATANAHFLFPTGQDQDVAADGDIGGWAGDLMTFYADWRTGEEEYGSTLQFCHDRLGVPGVTSSYGFSDLVEDADGFLIARAVSNGDTIVQAVQDLYNNGGGLQRFGDYFDNRWGTASNCYHSALYALLGVGTALGAARAFLIGLKGAMLPPILAQLPGGMADIEGFAQGLVDALQARRGMESQMRTTYEANHASYLRSARESEK